MTKILTLGMSAAAIAIHSVSASITFDIRAAGGAPGGGKILNLFPGAIVQLEVWAQIANATPVNNIFGVQSILGSIVSSNAPGIIGSIDPMVFPSVFNSVSVAGTSVELSSPTDTLKDLGALSTTATAGYIKGRKDPTIGGETITGGTFFFVTANQPLGATFQPITNGFEFLVGTTTLRITDGAGNASLNWKIPAFTTAALKGQIAAWTDGDNVNNTGSGQFAEMSIGTPIALVVVPEPSAFGMVLLGAMGLVGFRRITGHQRA